jgi:acetyltransferase
MVNVMSQLGTAAPASRTPPPFAPREGLAWRLYDGTPVQLRPIGPEDAELELEFLDQLSPEMRSLRFLGLIKEPCPNVARELTALDPARALGFAAVVSSEGRERQIGAAHLRTNAARDRCDCAVTVSDAWRRRGVGSALMRLLIAAARAHGIRHMRAFAPARNDGSEHLALRLGFQRHLDLRDPAVVAYHLDL